MLQKSPMFAYVPAKDVPRARHFYEQILGFVPGKELAGGVTYECGGGTACFLYPTPNAGTSSASQAFWQVADIAKEVKELREKGVVFEEYELPHTKMVGSIATAGGAKAAWFKDTEGNILAIIQEE
jgi:catechol 2,3-dioxygenase-like lactoylglutathione lyase family enzyme